MNDAVDHRVPVYVIHMASQPKRWESIQTRLTTFTHLHPILVHAVDGDSIPEEKRRSATHWSYRLRTGYPGMTAGEFGCACSHVKAWRMLAESAEPWGAVFEDDVQLSEHLEDAIHSSAFLLEDGRPTLVLLSTNLIACRRPSCRQGGYCFHRLVSGAGAYAYLLNKAAAARMGSRVRPFRTPIDWWRPKAGWGVRVFVLVPHVASYSEDRSDSLLEAPRQAFWRAHSSVSRSFGMRLGLFFFRFLPSLGWRMRYRLGLASLFPKQW